MESSKAFKIKPLFLLVILTPLQNVTVILFRSPCEAGATVLIEKKKKAQCSVGNL